MGIRTWKSFGIMVLLVFTGCAKSISVSSQFGRANSSEPERGGQCRVRSPLTRARLPEKIKDRAIYFGIDLTSKRIDNLKVPVAGAVIQYGEAIPMPDTGAEHVPNLGNFSLQSLEVNGVKVLFPEISLNGSLPPGYPTVSRGYVYIGNDRLSFSVEPGSGQFPCNTHEPGAGHSVYYSSLASPDSEYRIRLLGSQCPNVYQSYYRFEGHGDGDIVYELEAGGPQGRRVKEAVLPTARNLWSGPVISHKVRYFYSDGGSQAYLTRLEYANEVVNFNYNSSHSLIESIEYTQDPSRSVFFQYSEHPTGPKLYGVRVGSIRSDISGHEFVYESLCDGMSDDLIAIKDLHDHTLVEWRIEDLGDYSVYNGVRYPSTGQTQFNEVIEFSSGPSNPVVLRNADHPNDLITIHLDETGRPVRSETACEQEVSSNNFSGTTYFPPDHPDFPNRPSQVRRSQGGQYTVIDYGYADIETYLEGSLADSRVTSGTNPNEHLPDNMKSDHTIQLRNRMRSHVPRILGTGGLETIYDYDGQGDLIRKKTNWTMNDPGETTEYRINIQPTVTRYIVIQPNGRADVVGVDNIEQRVVYEATNVRPTDGALLEESLVTTYEYDLNGRLSQVRDPRGTIVHWTYMSSVDSRLARVERMSSHEWTEIEVLYSEEFPELVSGTRKRFRIDSSEADIVETSYLRELPGLALVTRVTVKNSTDLQHEVETASIVYDLEHNARVLTECGFFDDAGLDSSGPLCKSYHYNDSGSVENGLVTEIYDSNSDAQKTGYSVFTEYTACTLSGTQQEIVAGGARLTSRWTWDAFMRPVTKTVSEGSSSITTTMFYDSQNRIDAVQKSTEQGILVSDIHYAYSDPASRRITAVSDLVSQTKKELSYTRIAHSWLVSGISIYSDLDGQHLVAREEVPNAVDNFDEFGRPMRKVVRVEGVGISRFNYDYDRFGALRSVTQESPDLGTRMIAYYHRDDLGRIVQTTVPDQSTSVHQKFIINGKIWSRSTRTLLQDGNSIEETTVSDMFGRTVSAKSDQNESFSELKYNAQGMVAESTQYFSKNETITRKYLYDSTGRSIAGKVGTRSIPMQEVYRNSFDGLGQLISRTDGVRGNLTEFIRRDLGRDLTIRFPNGRSQRMVTRILGDSEQFIETSEQYAGSLPVLTHFNARGQITDRRQGDDIFAYTYDNESKLLTELNAILAGTVSREVLSYDHVGRVSRRDSTVGTTVFAPVEFSYYEDGLPHSTTYEQPGEPGARLTIEKERNSFGQIVAILKNGLPLYSIDYGSFGSTLPKELRNDHGQIVRSYQYAREKTPYLIGYSDPVSGHVSYQYDSNGLLIHKSDTGRNVQEDMRYDSGLSVLSRYSQQSPVFGTVTQNLNTGIHGELDRAIQGKLDPMFLATDHFSYDAEMRPTQELSTAERRRMTYSLAGLSGISTSQGVPLANVQSNAFGMNSVINESNTSKAFLYHTNGDLLYHRSGSVETITVFDDTGLALHSLNSTGREFTNFGDPLNHTATGFVSNSGQMIRAYHNSAFPNAMTRFVQSGTGPVVQDSELPPFRVNGLADGVLGKAVMPYRFFDPQTLRFLTRDPAGIRDGLNMFQYLSSSTGEIGALNPLATVDRLGLSGSLPGGENQIAIITSQDQDIPPLPEASSPDCTQKANNSGSGAPFVGENKNWRDTLGINDDPLMYGLTEAVALPLARGFVNLGAMFIDFPIAVYESVTDAPTGLAPDGTAYGPGWSYVNNNSVHEEWGLVGHSHGINATVLGFQVLGDGKKAGTRNVETTLGQDFGESLAAATIWLPGPKNAPKKIPGPGPRVVPPPRTVLPTPKPECPELVTRKFYLYGHGEWEGQVRLIDGQWGPLGPDFKLPDNVRLIMPGKPGNAMLSGELKLFSEGKLNASCLADRTVFEPGSTVPTLRLHGRNPGESSLYSSAADRHFDEVIRAADGSPQRLQDIVDRVSALHPEKMNEVYWGACGGRNTGGAQ